MHGYRSVRPGRGTGTGAPRGGLCVAGRHDGSPGSRRDHARWPAPVARPRSGIAATDQAPAAVVWAWWPALARGPARLPRPALGLPGTRRGQRETQGQRAAGFRPGGVRGWPDIGVRQRSSPMAATRVRRTSGMCRAACLAVRQAVCAAAAGSPGRTIKRCGEAAAVGEARTWAASAVGAWQGGGGTAAWTVEIRCSRGFTWNNGGGAEHGRPDLRVDRAVWPFRNRSLSATGFTWNSGRQAQNRPPTGSNS